MLLDALDQLPEAQPIIFGAFARAFAPRPTRRVSEWAEEVREVSAESGSRYPGRWRNDRAPHLEEIMDALGPQDPCEDVVVVASAQVGKTEIGLNFFGYVVDVDPGPMITVLPSIEEASKFNKTKLQPSIDATPALRQKVLEYTDKSERGSTVNFKRFARGFNQLTFAGSSKGLQMISARYTWGDEISEWPSEAGQRGGPIDQLKKRTVIYERDRKRLWTSTPSIKGSCKITELYEESDQRRRYVPCPHCGAYQLLKFENLKWDNDEWPHRAWFRCAAHGCVIESTERLGMLRAGVWVPTAGDGPGDWIEPGDVETWRARPAASRVRGYHIWASYSLMVSWDQIVADWLGAEGKEQRLKAFTQQVLGEAFEEKGDAPDPELLLARRVPGLQRGVPGIGPLIFTGAVDCQSNRVEWAVWGWSEGMTRWLADWGMIEGDPHGAEVWAALASEVLPRRYSPSGGEPIDVEAWAVDSGYATNSVYAFCRGRPRVFAVDGRPGRTFPMIGTPAKVDITIRGVKRKKGALLWPVGGWSLKSDHYASARLTLDRDPEKGGPWAPGSMILPGDVDLAYCRQLTAEYLATVEVKRTGQSYQEWRKLAGQANEALDIACYARAMANHIGVDRLTIQQWATLRAQRAAPPEKPQGDLFAVEVAPAVEPARPARAAKPARRRRSGRSSYLRD